MSKKKLSEFHYHEALDRTYIIINIIENSLTYHPVFKKHKKLRKKVNKAIDVLCDAYQEIGKMEVKKFGINIENQ